MSQQTTDKVKEKSMSLIELKYQTGRRFEKLLRTIVWALPRKVVMWAFIRVVAHATTGKYSNQIVPKLTVIDALSRWDEK